MSCVVSLFSESLWVSFVVAQKVCGCPLLFFVVAQKVCGCPLLLLSESLWVSFVVAPLLLVPVELRKDYMAALEAASVHQDIQPFAILLAGLVTDRISGAPPPRVPKE